MKSLIPAFSLALIIFFAAISSLFGVGIMLIDLYTGGENFMQGFTVFCLGTILLFSCVIAYICTKINDNVEVVGNTMIKYFESEIDKAAPVHNPFKNMFSNFGIPTEVKIIGAENNEETEKLMKILFGQDRDEKKSLEDMNSEELEMEKNKAIEAQDYERAAHIKNLIDSLKSN